MELFKKITDAIFSVQEKMLQRELSSVTGVRKQQKRKFHYGYGCMLDLAGMAEAEREQFESEILDILKSNDYNPEKLLEYLQNNGTPVYRMKDAKKILYPIGEEEGFIYPAIGAKGLYLALSILKKFQFKTDEMFVLSEGEINKYCFIYNFYNWFAYKHGIAGVDKDSKKLLNKYLFTDSDIKELKLDEIYKLKDAIRQDKAALEFVINLCKSYDGAKNALNKMQDGGAKL